MFKTIEGLKWRANMLSKRDPVGNAKIVAKIMRKVRQLEREQTNESSRCADQYCLDWFFTLFNGVNYFEDDWMKVIDRKPVPYYELTCSECGSTIEYKASEVHNCHITCPVCETSLWASTCFPKTNRYENIDFTWDTEIGLWIATSSSLRFPGLAVAGQSFDEVVKKVKNEIIKGEKKCDQLMWIR